MIIKVNKKILKVKKELTPLIAKKIKAGFYSYQNLIDYKNVVLLRKFFTSEGKIIPRRINKLNAKQQRKITKAIKNARMVALLPFKNHTTPTSF